MAGGASDLGDRDVQEDAWLVASRPGALVCAVCDGMGGSSSGQAAADLAVETVRAAFDRGEGAERVLAAVGAANLAIYARSQAGSARTPGSDPRWIGMGTTADVAFFERGRAYLAHAGDGRIYRFRRGRLAQLTTDHTLRNELLRERPDISEAELATYPRNIIVRALGFTETLAVDQAEVDTMPGDRFVLCSDGLTSLVDDEQIGALLKLYAEPVLAARALIDAALDAPPPPSVVGRYYRDNITVVVHAVGEGA